MHIISLNQIVKYSCNNFFTVNFIVSTEAISIQNVESMNISEKFLEILQLSFEAKKLIKDKKIVKLYIDIYKCS